MFALFFLLWPVIQVSASLICLAMDASRFAYTSALSRTRKWEKNGEIYQKIFRVRSWKKFLPDGGAHMKGGYAKKHPHITTKESLELYLVESCRGELAHILAILPFWVFGFFGPARIILYMFIYALVLNLPCIITQRYNRPRVVRLLQKLERSEAEG